MIYTFASVEERKKVLDELALGASVSGNHYIVLEEVHFLPNEIGKKSTSLEVRFVLSECYTCKSIGKRCYSDDIYMKFFQNILK